MTTPDLARAPALDVPVLTAEDIVAIVWRRRLPALGAFAGMLILVLLAVARITPQYEAQASLDLNVGRRPVQFGPEPGLDQPQHQFNQLNTQRELLLSTTVLDQALQASGLLQTKAYRDDPEPIAVLRSRLKVITNRDSWTLVTILRDEDPRRAEQALQAVLEAYLAYQARRQQERADQSLVFLQSEVDKARAALARLEDAERQFAAEHNLIATDPDHNFIAFRVTGYHEQRVALTRELALSETSAARIRDADLLTTPEERRATLLRLDQIATQRIVGQQKQELFDLEARRAVLAQKYLDKHPRLVEVNENIAAKRTQLDEAIAITAAGITSINARLIGQRDALDARIGQEEAALAAYRDDLRTWKRITETVEAERKLYRELLDRLGQERITARLEQQTVALADRPAASPKPANINRLLFAAIGLALATVAGLGIPVLLELIDWRLRDPREAARRAGAPLLAELPRSPGVTGLAPAPDEPPALGEAVRGLRAKLRLQGRRGPGQGLVIAVVSAQSGDGRSLVATRLAAALAASGLRTLLVDGDLRRPCLDILLDLQPGHGFSHLLAGDPAIAPVTTAQERLDLMPAGTVPPNPSELLNSHCLSEWFAHCRAIYDYVVVDTPPLADVADALLIAAESDHLLLVARAGRTERASFDHAVARLQPIHPKLLGVVWNADSRRDPDRDAGTGDSTSAPA